jgi:hypothetical protein
MIQCGMHLSTCCRCHPNATAVTTHDGLRSSQISPSVSSEHIYDVVINVRAKINPSQSQEGRSSGTLGSGTRASQRTNCEEAESPSADALARRAGFPQHWQQDSVGSPRAVCAQACRREVVTVELWTEASVKGTLAECDFKMKCLPTARLSLFY